jgi:type IV pilus assembly protein PilB
MEVDGRQVDVRVATVGTHWGEKTVMRILDKSKPLFKLGELGMPKDTHQTLSKLIRAPFGMVICAGPTGSGKTTTLYAALSELNETHRNIMTIEDPVEYVFPSINQIQTNEQAGLTFATGLKSILRQDPDVILVGESRDVDTARIAVQSALTGHFVLSSLHATDAVAALHRFLDMGIESFLIASSVLAVVGQRLVRRTCTYCKAKITPSPEDLAFYAETGGRPKRVWYAGEGCNLCAGTGYSERIGVYELLRITPEIKRLVVGWATQEELRRMAVSQGMRTLQDEALHLVENDVTTIAEIVRSIYAF